MVDLPLGDKTRWLSLGDACRLLDASQAALRQWADGGHLRVYRTPGGHRRFLRADVVAFAGGNSSPGDADGPLALEGSVLKRIRRRLHQEGVARQPWYHSVESEGRVRMRLFGRRLLSLLAQQTPPGRRRQGALAEAHMLGRQYGAEMAERGVALKDTVEAFIFFRKTVLDSATSSAWGRILELADRVLVGVTESHQDLRSSATAPGQGGSAGSNNQANHSGGVDYGDGLDRPEAVEPGTGTLPTR